MHYLCVIHIITTFKISTLIIILILQFVNVYDIINREIINFYKEVK
nr:MAG TPA: hypothetical protein [Caudoviricetes sp.]